MVATIDLQIGDGAGIEDRKRLKEKWERECVFTLTFLLFPFPFIIPL